MNAQLSSTMPSTTMLSATIPLPTILDQPAFTGPGRRHRIENYCLAPLDVERFNHLLLRLGRRQAPLERDQVVSAARELCDCSSTAGEPPSIRQRMHRLEAAALMVEDRAWEAANEAADAARLVMDYARASNDLIPDWVPRIGRLDDAIVIDTAWPRLAAEVAGYLDFCRLRGVEAQYRGGSDSALRFDRSDWEQARREEQALAVHQREVRESSYLPRSTAMFQVH